MVYHLEALHRPVVADQSGQNEMVLRKTPATERFFRQFLDSLIGIVQQGEQIIIGDDLLGRAKSRQGCPPNLCVLILEHGNYLGEQLGITGAEKKVDGPGAILRTGILEPAQPQFTAGLTDRPTRTMLDQGGAQDQGSAAEI